MQMATFWCYFICAAAMCIPFGWYQFANPDTIANNGKFCYANSQSSSPVTFDAHDAVNVTSRFELVFAIFFYSIVANFALQSGHALGNAIRAERLAKCVGSLISIKGCADLGVLILASVWRWGHEGKVCSGDYISGPTEGETFMLASGKFLNIYLIVSFSFIVLMCCLIFCCMSYVARMVGAAAAEEGQRHR